MMTLFSKKTPGGDNVHPNRKCSYSKPLSPLQSCVMAYRHPDTQVQHFLHTLSGDFSVLIISFVRSLCTFHIGWSRFIVKAGFLLGEIFRAQEKASLLFFIEFRQKRTMKSRICGKFRKPIILLTLRTKYQKIAAPYG